MATPQMATAVPDAAKQSAALGVPAAEAGQDQDGAGDGVGGGAFECNICLELASEPVITMCGHLYCWPCLYRWIQVDCVFKQCPVCKAGVEEDKVIPLYGRGGGSADPRKRKGLTNLPNRPAGQRPVATQRLGEQMGMSMGLGFLPSLFGVRFPNAYGAANVYDAEPVTAEQQHQVFLSRFLLMLGSFVIMCLLFFCRPHAPPSIQCCCSPGRVLYPPLSRLAPDADCLRVTLQEGSGGGGGGGTVLQLDRAVQE